MASNSNILLLSEYLDKKQNSGEQRVETREKCWIKSGVRNLTGGLRPAVLLDVSNRGAMVRIEGGLSLDQYVELVGLDLCGSRICSVRWTKDDTVGLKFLFPEQTYA